MHYRLVRLIKLQTARHGIFAQRGVLLLKKKKYWHPAHTFIDLRFQCVCVKCELYVYILMTRQNVDTLIRRLLKMIGLFCKRAL